MVLPPEPGADDFDCIALVDARAQQLAEGDVTLADVVGRRYPGAAATDRVLLVIDQAEELCTLAEADARTRFIDLFLEATNRAPLTVVLTLRGDFYGRALEHRALADRLDRGVVNLGPMNEEELARAILLPARKVGLQFEDGLVGQILGDVGGEPGNLPLLVLLEGLWQRRAHGRLAHTDYDALGGVAGAVVTRADQVHRMDAAQQMAARQFLVRLVAPGEGREDTRAVAELPGDDPVLESVVPRQLANARLVVTDRGQGDFRQLVEDDHEALIRSWPQLRQWVDEDREFLRTLRRANDAKAMWLAEGRAADRLLQPGRQLGEAEELLARRVEFADLELRNYIAASQWRARRATHVRRTVALGALALAAVASLAAWGAITSRGEAERNRQIAEENRQLAEHRAERLSAALAEARASLIWSNLALKGDRLERQEVDALWQVATADPEARHAFLRQMGQSRSAVLKVARQPEPMLRALGLTLSLEDKRALLEPVLALMAQTRDTKTLRLLARAAQSMPINLTTTQAKAAQNRVVEVFATTQDPYALQSLAEAMQALGVELIGATMREATVGRIMRGLAT